MQNKKDVISLILCYALWGFQPLYWALLKGVDPYTMLGCRIVMAAVFSVLLLAVTKRLSQLRDVFRDRRTMKFLLPATLFLLADWAVFIIVVNAGHVVDAGLGYYINPLILFGLGVLLFKEKCTKMQLISLGVAAVGVIISTVAFGDFPYISLIIAVNWAVYVVLKKNVSIDGVVSIAAETLILSPLAIAFLLIFRTNELAAMSTQNIIFLILSGVVTALPMFLYTNCVSRFSLIVMCFAQYLSPTFNLVCGLIMGESFSVSQIVSLAFFVTAITVFTVSEIRQQKARSELPDKG